MIFFQFLLMLHLANLIEIRFIKITFHNDDDHKFNIFNYTFQNSTFIILIILNLLNMYDFYLSYSLISVIICPFKTWLLLYAIYLRYKCTQLSANHFEQFIDSSKLNQNQPFINEIDPKKN